MKRLIDDPEVVSELRAELQRYAAEHAQVDLKRAYADLEDSLQLKAANTAGAAQGSFSGGSWSALSSSAKVLIIAAFGGAFVLGVTALRSTEHTPHGLESVQPSAAPPSPALSASAGEPAKNSAPSAAPQTSPGSASTAQHASSARPSAAPQTSPGSASTAQHASSARPPAALQTNAQQPSVPLQTNSFQATPALQTDLPQPSTALPANSAQPSSALPTDFPQPSTALQKTSPQPSTALQTNASKPSAALQTNPTPPSLARASSAKTRPTALDDAELSVSRHVAASSSSRREIAQLARIKTLLETDPAAARRLIRAAQREFPAGLLVEEREGLDVIALFALGQHERARTNAGRFVARYPQSPLRPKLERLIADAPE